MTVRAKAYLGIYPGQGGAAALIQEDGHEVMDWPGAPALVVNTLRTWTLAYEIRLCALEKMSAMPKQGVVSMFTFGQNLGTWQGILSTLAIPYTMPTPASWQKALVDRKAGPDPKTRSLVTARRLFPDAVADFHRFLDEAQARK